jgi:signal peptidase
VKGERVKRLKKIMLVSVPLVVVIAIIIFVSGVLPYKVYVLHTGSMTPTVPSRSAVIVYVHQYHVGQVVTFTEDGQTVTHRLISINAAGLITTKGDANATADPWHPPQSQIIGGVVATVPELGYWLVYLKSPLGAASVLLAMLAIWQIWALGSSSPPAAVPVPRQPRARHRRRRIRISL